jgi:hypothetical protein
MNMNEKLVEQLLDELIPSLEAVETQSAAILKFLKDKGIGSDEELAPYFEEAGNASNVRWRAARLRMNSLIASAVKDAKRNAEKESAKDAQKAPAPAAVDKNKESGQEKKTDVEKQVLQKGGDGSQPREPLGAKIEEKKKTDEKQEPKEPKKTQSKEDAGENAA